MADGLSFERKVPGGLRQTNALSFYSLGNEADKGAVAYRFPDLCLYCNRRSCSQLRTKCRLKRLPESELKEAIESLFGDGYEGKIVQNVERIVISDDEVIFQFKEGGAYRWQRQYG